MKNIQLKILKTAEWVREMLACRQGRKTKIKIELPRGFVNIVEQRRAFDILVPSG